MEETLFSQILGNSPSWEAAVQTASERGVRVPDIKNMYRALEAFVSCVEVTGGLTADDGPVADPEWLDLAEAAGYAASVLGVELTVEGDDA
jgi:hypothetical protein